MVGKLWVFNLGRTWKYYSLDEKEKYVRDLVLQKTNHAYVPVAQAYGRTPRTRIVKPCLHAKNQLRFRLNSRDITLKRILQFDWSRY